LENVLANAGAVKKPKLRENLLASLDSVRRGRQLISLYEDLPLPVQLEDLERKAVDEPRARKLFTELEFVRLVNDLPRPPPTPPSGARSMASTLEDVQRLVDRARAAKRFAILTLTSEDEPLRDDLLGLAVSLPDESVYVPLGHRRGGGASGAACALVEGARRLCEALGEDLRADPELLGLYSEIEKPLIEVLANLELTGIRVDVPRLQRLSDEIGRQIDALLREIFQLAGGEFLPASTQQLAEVLYKRLNLPVLKRGKTGPSTDQEVLEELAQQHPLPAKVLEHRQLTKLKSTYLDALPAVIGKDGRLHTTFDQAVAATGRLSSVNPNLQNIPIRTPIGA